MLSSQQTLDISHAAILSKLKLFLLALGEKEVFPDKWENELCNAYGFMYTRTATSPTLKKMFFDRLIRLAEATPQQIVEMAYALKKYKSNYQKHALTIQHEPGAPKDARHIKIKTMALKKMDDQELVEFAENLNAFISSLLCVASLNKENPVLHDDDKPIPHTDYIQLLKMLGPDPVSDEKSVAALEHATSFCFYFQNNELSEQLSHIPNNTHTLISDQSHIGIISKIDNQYEIYGNTNKSGVIICKEADEAVKELEKIHFTDLESLSENRLMNYKIFSPKHITIPSELKPENALKNILAKRTRNSTVDESSQKGVTALSFAAYNGDIETVEALLAHKADPNITADDGETAAYVAAMNGHTDIMRQLHAHHADFALAKNDGMTPMYVAAQRGKLRAIQSLTAYGFSIYTPIKGGWTPIYTAVTSGQTDIVAHFLKHDLTPTKTINGTKSVIEEAYHLKEKEMFSLLTVTVFASKQWSGISMLLYTMQHKSELSKTNRELIRKHFNPLINATASMIKEMKSSDQVVALDCILSEKNALGQMLGKSSHQSSIFQKTSTYKRNKLAKPAHELASQFKHVIKLD